MSQRNGMTRSDRVAQMTKQEELIAKKRQEIEEKIRTKALAKAVAEAQSGTTKPKKQKDSKSPPLSAQQLQNTFSNDGSFLENFKKITEAAMPPPNGDASPKHNSGDESSSPEYDRSITPESYTSGRSPTPPQFPTPISNLLQLENSCARSTTTTATTINHNHPQQQIAPPNLSLISPSVTSNSLPISLAAISTVIAVPPPPPPPPLLTTHPLPPPPPLESITSHSNVMQNINITNNISHTTTLASSIASTSTAMSAPCLVPFNNSTTQSTSSSAYKQCYASFAANQAATNKQHIVTAAVTINNNNNGNNATIISTSNMLHANSIPPPLTPYRPSFNMSVPPPLVPVNSLHSVLCGTSGGGSSSTTAAVQRNYQLHSQHQQLSTQQHLALPPLHAIPPPKPIALHEIPQPKDLDLNTIPQPKLNLEAIKVPDFFMYASAKVFSDNEIIPTSLESLVELIAENGDAYEAKIRSRKKDVPPSLWFLFDMDSQMYKSYRRLLTERRMARANRQSDKYDPAAIYLDDEDYSVPVVPEKRPHLESDGYDSDSEYMLEAKQRNLENMKKNLTSKFINYGSSDSESDDTEMDGSLPLSGATKPTTNTTTTTVTSGVITTTSTNHAANATGASIATQSFASDGTAMTATQQQQQAARQARKRKSRWGGRVDTHVIATTSACGAAVGIANVGAPALNNTTSTVTTAAAVTSYAGLMQRVPTPGIMPLLVPPPLLPPPPPPVQLQTAMAGIGGGSVGSSNSNNITTTTTITAPTTLMLSKVTRTDPALLAYARQNYGTIQLSEEDWQKCEDHYKINLLFQDLLRKREEIDNLAKCGRFKYEYDSDEDVTGGTWEHKLRNAEMEATQTWADALNKQSEGKHHIGDFLPPEELKKFMETYNAKMNNREPDISDYKEYKLKEDNIGFQMLQKLGWKEGQGLGAGGSGIINPINKAQQRDSNQGLGIAQSTSFAEDDNEYDAYRKRMMLAYRFRPNPLNNPRRAYY